MGSPLQVFTRFRRTNHTRGPDWLLVVVCDLFRLGKREVFGCASGSSGWPEGRTHADTVSADCSHFYLAGSVSQSRAQSIIDLRDVDGLVYTPGIGTLTNHTFLLKNSVVFVSLRLVVLGIGIDSLELVIEKDLVALLEAFLWVLKVVSRRTHPQLLPVATNKGGLGLLARSHPAWGTFNFNRDILCRRVFCFWDRRVCL